MNCRIIFATFLFFLFPGNLFSMNNVPDTLVSQTQKEIQFDTDSNVLPLSFDKESIAEFRDDPAFDYRENAVEENWWSQFKHWLWEGWLDFWHWVFGDYKAGGIVAFIIKILPYAIIFGIVIFIIWLFYKLNPGAHFLKSKEAPEVYFSAEEEIIKRKDIRELIEKALAGRDFRLAIRYYYLLLLKNMSAAEFISYEPDKTNTDYISEISLVPLQTDFRKATLLYDYIWYGNFELTEPDFNKAQKTFLHLDGQIPKTGA